MPQPYDAIGKSINPKYHLRYAITASHNRMSRNCTVGWWGVWGGFIYPTDPQSPPTQNHAPNFRLHLCNPPLFYGQSLSVCPLLYQQIALLSATPTGTPKRYPYGSSVFPNCFIVAASLYLFCVSASGSIFAFRGILFSGINSPRPLRNYDFRFIVKTHPVG